MTTRTATTAHGEVEYETVECDSCNNEVAQEKARDFVIGDIKASKSWTHRSHARFEIYDEGRYRGTLCPYCSDMNHIDVDMSSSSPNMRDIPRAIWNAHRNIVTFMVRHLNGEVGGDDDVILGLATLILYMVVLTIIGFLIANLVGAVIVSVA